MDNNDYLNEAALRMEQAIERFQDGLKKIRTGRASASMLDSVRVEVYGQLTPLQHVATVNVVDAQMIQITPFDPNSLAAISAAIRDDQSLGLNPADDGKVIRVPMPPLTEDRRRDIVKQIKEKAEEARIGLRNIRHDALNSVKSDEKSGDLSKDDVRSAETKLNELIDKFNQTVESSAKAKEQEIMTV